MAASSYASRLSEMEQWYDDLLTQPDCEQTLLADYLPHAPYLSGLTGRVVDIGGGVGLASRFLANASSYVVVEPAAVWRSEAWAEFGARFRGTGIAPQAVVASGEDLPFGEAEFDASIAFWSLNHVADPERCMTEMLRVTRRGGSMRIVLEDMEPSWRDLALETLARAWGRIGRSHRQPRFYQPLRRAIPLKLSGDWPLQKDHIRIREGEFLSWIAEAARPCMRRWIGGHLTYELVRL